MSLSSNGHGSGGFIGGGFAGATSSSGAPPTRARRGSFGAATREGRRWWNTRGRCMRLVVLVVGAVAVWWLVARWQGEAKPRQKLAYRWWEAEEIPSEDLAALLPKPTLPPRPPRPKPPPPHSHTLSQLLRLPSTVSFSSSTPPEWTAVVHLTSSSQLISSYLAPLVTSLTRQTPLAPSRILLLVPKGMEPAPSVLSSLGSLVATVPFASSTAPVVALAEAAQSRVESDYILFIDGHLPSKSDVLSREYVKTLLHASGTREYGSALLTAGGLALSPSSPSPSSAECVFPATSAARVAAPSLPFLLPTSWLLPRDPTRAGTSVLQGLATDLPLELALAAALWTKHAIPAYALPLVPPSSSSASAPDGHACERLRRSLAASGSGAAALFAPAAGGGSGLRLLQAAGDRAKGGLGGAREPSIAERAEEARVQALATGTAVLLVSGREELDAVRGMACRFAGMAARGEGDEDVRRDFKVLVADYDPHAEGDDGARDAACHLDLTLLGAPSSSSSSAAAGPGSATSEPISLALVDALDALSPAPAFVLYLTDGPRAREFDEVLRWMGGFFGARRGGERLSRVRAEREMLKGSAAAGGEGRGRPTVVGMTREEARRAEWVGALDLEALRHFHTPRIDLSVVTNDRPVSLHRLLSSLQTAYYFGDDVSLAVNLEQTADRLTHRLVDDMRWPHGSFALRHRILLGGLMPAIVESWYPTSNDTYGVLLEDDVEVSPLFYGWLKFAILQYRYTLAGRRASPRMFGVSLYQQKNIELRPEGRQPFDAHKLFEGLSLHPTTPYLSQIPCSWGAAYFPEHWREFHAFLALRLSELALPISEPLVPAIRSNKWPRSWKKYFIELVYLRGYTMLYPNYPDFESLSTNHLEKGTHVKTARVDEKKKAMFEVPLLDRDASLLDTLPGGAGHERLPEWDALPALDLWGALASEHELLERGWQSTRMLGSCGAALPSLAEDALARPRYDARELLCERGWDRETEGRLVDAQPLALRGVGARPASAEPEVEDEVAPPVLRRAEGDSHAHHAHAEEDAAVRALEVDDADAGSRAGLFPDAEGEGDGEEEEEGGDAARARRKKVDFAARRAHAEEAELGLDESESEAEGELAQAPARGRAVEEERRWYPAAAA
ncbi:hypothetical protein JCM10449v2_006838 [Rhodotorula kratochvilovae]